MLNCSLSTAAALGIPLHSTTLDEIIALIEQQIRERGFHQLAVSHVGLLRKASSDTALRDVLCSCDFVIPGDFTSAFVSRIVGAPLKEVISETNLLLRIAELSARRGYGIFLLGESDSRLERTTKLLRKLNPNLRIVGRYSSEGAGKEDPAEEEILLRIERAQPDILFLAAPSPNADQWISKNQHRLSVPFCMAAPAAIEELSRMYQPSPWYKRLTQSNGIRLKIQKLANRPSRLFLNGVFISRVISGWIFAKFVQGRRAGEAGIHGKRIGNTELIAVVGNLTGTTHEEFKTRSVCACFEGMNIVLDLSKTGYVGPSAIATLITLENWMRQRNESLWLAEVSGSLQKALQTLQLHNYFMTTRMVSDALYRTAKAENRILAAITPPLDSSTDQVEHVNIRVEELQDVCRRILDVNRPVDEIFAGSRSVSASD